MPTRPGLLQRLARGPASRPGDAWDEVLALAIARLLSCRHGARVRPGLHAAALAALALADDRHLRELCDQLARSLERLDRRLHPAAVALAARDELGCVRLTVEGGPTDARLRCVVRLSPRLPPEIVRSP